MIISIANPIYDSVFKYLMEDERIARTLLSALLKKEVLSVHTRRHEYTNGVRDKISMFRIDFGAEVLEEDGRRVLTLIELQKTWLETETLRFRQYLGAQYANPENIMKDSGHNGHALPTVAVYLLGHRVGDIEEPVLYVNHNVYDYNGRRVEKGIPEPFIESLTHNSIIVQIPLLRGNVNNRLDKVLSVFDQSQKASGNSQIINIDDNDYADDTDMQYILRRLLAAASNSQLRQDMNVEDEYFKAIENRDTAIMTRDKRIAEQDAQLAKQDAQLAKQDAQIAEQGAQLAAQGAQLAEKDERLAEKDEKLAEQGAQLAEKENQLRSIAQALSRQGVDVDSIAGIMRISAEQVKDLLKRTE